MKTLCAALIYVLMLVTTAFAAAPLKIGADVPYPPFADKDPVTGTLIGFDIEMSQAICRYLERDCEFVILPFDQLIPELINGSIDMVVAGLAKTKEREETILFTDRYFRSSSLFIEIAGTNPPISAETLKGKKIGVQNGSIQHEYLQLTYGDTITIVPVPALADVIAAITSKQVDLAFIEALPVYHLLKQEAYQNLDLIGNPMSFYMDSFIAVAKTNTDLRDQINAAILAIRTSGDYLAISRKYFDIDIY